MIFTASADEALPTMCVYRLVPPCSIDGKWNAAVYAIASIWLSVRFVDSGTAGRLTMFTIWPNVSPKSGLPGDTYRFQKLVSIVRWRRLVIRAGAVSPGGGGRVQKGFRLTGCAPIDAR